MPVPALQSSALSGDERTAVDNCLQRWRPGAGRQDAAVTIAELPERIAGFGPVKQRKAQVTLQRPAQLLSVYEADEPVVGPLPGAAAARTA